MATKNLCPRKYHGPGGFPVDLNGRCIDPGCDYERPAPPPLSPQQVNRPTLPVPAGNFSEEEPPTQARHARPKRTTLPGTPPTALDAEDRTTRLPDDAEDPPGSMRDPFPSNHREEE
jgi:hypothetical protein